MPPLTIDDLKYRARLSQRLTGIILAVVVLSTLIRPLIANMSPWLTTAGICNALVLLGIYYLISSGRVLEKAPLMVCHGCSLMVMMLFCLTGGSSSQFAAIVPVLPMVAIMLGGAPLTQDVADLFGADGYAESAGNAVQEAIKMISSLRKLQEK